MKVMQGIRKGFRAFKSPGKESSVNFTIKDALKFYYPFAVIGFVIAFVVALALQVAGVPIASGFSSLSGGIAAVQDLSWMHFGSVVGTLAALMFVLVPIGFFIDAAIIQLIGKFFLKVWNGPYKKTFTAYAFAALPTVMAYWLTLFSTAGFVAYAIIGGVWSFIVLVIALAAQHKVSRLRSIGVLFVMMAIVLLIVLITLAVALAAVLPTLKMAVAGGAI